MRREVRFIYIMSADRLIDLRERKEINWRTFGVGIIIASFSNKEGKCWPSIKTVAKRAGIFPRHVHTCINELINFGILEKDFIPGKPSTIRLKPMTKTVTTDPDSHDQNSHTTYDQNSQGGMTKMVLTNRRNTGRNKKKEYTNRDAKKIIDLWNLNMGAKISPAKGHLKNIEKCICAVPDFLEKYEKAAPKFKGVDDSGWPQGKVSFPWSLVLNKPDGLFYPVVDRVLDGVYDKKEKNTKTSFEERYKRATEMKDWKDG